VDPATSFVEFISATFDLFLQMRGGCRYQSEGLLLDTRHSDLLLQLIALTKIRVT
jgi:hypothetical protein